jgi:hypothetical protein
MTAELTVHLTNDGCIPGILTTPIFRWTGEYFGFLQNNALFAADGTYLGWVDGCAVWHKDGTFCGHVVEQNYILKKPMRLEPLARIPKKPPIPPVPPIPGISRSGRMPRLGCRDALDEC